MSEQQTAEDLELWRRALAIRMDKMEERIEACTEATERVDRNTSELVSILSSWKGAMAVLDFMGKVAKPLAAIGAVLGAWFTWRAQK